MLAHCLAEWVAGQLECCLFVSLAVLSAYLAVSDSLNVRVKEEVIDFIRQDKVIQRQLLSLF